MVTGLHDSIHDSFFLVFFFWRLYGLNISFNKGWFCIKFLGFIRIPFKLRTDGWGCVTNGKILLFAFILGLRANCLSVKITFEIDFSIR